jgi:hypothetical protein
MTLLTELLNRSARRNNLVAAECSREQGADWPKLPNLRGWGGKLQAWARAEGVPQLS